ncbi:MAG: sulfite exporter TauE/SafE family protein, partial [Cyanobacteria bacterium J06628_4]
MAPTDIALLVLGGLASGLLAGLLGIGGGVLMVPLLLLLGFTIDQATATSLLAILVTASTGSWQNWHMGYLKPRQVLWLAAPAAVLVIVGTETGSLMTDRRQRSAAVEILRGNRGRSRTEGRRSRTEGRRSRTEGL